MAVDPQRGQRGSGGPGGGNGGGGPADQGAGEDQRLGPVLLEEFMRFLDVFLLEQARVGALEQRGPHLAAEEIAHLVAEDRGQQDEPAHRPQRRMERIRRHQQPRGEQQGVTRQEEADQQAGLREDDDQDADQAERGDQIVRVQPLRAELQMNSCCPG